ncbi:MAG: GNAT family N-acetyltransferase [Firmicutes bacterium]|nr:GNAT family N-acetyltransferase [Bacillota bacterium]
MGETIVLRPMMESDWSLLEEWNNDPNVLYYSEAEDVQGWPPNAVRELYRSVSQNAFCFIIEYNDIPVGECWLQKMNLPDITKEFSGLDTRRIDIMIGEKDYWGRGIGTTTISLLTKLGFEDEKADIIFGCNIADYNKRSLCAFLKNGFELYKTVEEPEGCKAKHSYYVLLKKERYAEILFARYRGINQFGKAYEYMLSNDTHAPGSVDRMLADKMVRLCDDTKKLLYAEPVPCSYEKGLRPALEAFVEHAVRGADSDEEILDRLLDALLPIVKKGEDITLDQMLFGGLEEEIIMRGSDWCTDMARVACILAQLAGIPARIIYAFNLKSAYSGHALIEAFYRGKWGVVDPIRGMRYLKGEDGSPASAWDLMNKNPVKAFSAGRADVVDYDQYLGVAVADYKVSDRKQFDYSVSTLNDYCKAILEESIKGWPNGLRWIFGEDSN